MSVARETPHNTEGSGELLILACRLFDRAATDPESTLTQAAQLVALARRRGDLRAQVRGLCAWAWAERYLLLERTAKRRLDLAVRLAVEHRVDRVEALNCRAAANQDLGRQRAAHADLLEARRLLEDELADSTHDPEELGRSAVRVDSQLATLLQNSGHLAEAEVIYLRVLKSVHATDRVRAIVGNNLALLLAQGGRYRRAHEVLDDVRPAAAAAGPAIEAMLLTARSWVTVRSGMLVEGMRLFDEAEQVIGQLGSPMARADHQVDLLDGLLGLRLVPEALTAARAALDRFEVAGARLMGAETRLRLAQIELLSGSPAQARETALAAEAEFARQRRSSWRAQALVEVAEARLTLGEGGKDEVVRARAAATRLETSGFADIAVRAHLVAGRLAVAADCRALAADSFRRARAGSRRASVLVRLHGMVAAAMAAELDGASAEALRLSRRGLRVLADHRAELPSQRLRAAASGHGVELGRIGLRIALRRRSARQVFEWMELTRAAALTGIPTESEPMPGPGAVREVLGEQLLVEYAAVDGRLVAVVVAGRHSRLVELGPEEQIGNELTMLHFALRRLARGRERGRADASDRVTASLQRLREWLLPQGLDPEQPLVVVPSASLRTIPWPALHRAPVSLSPSARLWTSSAAAPVAPARRVTLIAGPTLDGAVDEVTRLAALHRGATVLTPPGGTVDEALSAVRSADLVHLACHGHVRSDNPMFSALELSDGVLTAQALESGGRVPPRMVLSACNAAADSSLPGGEQLGFVSALLAHGAQGLIASLTLVPDLDVVDFMISVHTTLRNGSTMAQALHTARAATEPSEMGQLIGASFVAYGAG